MLTEAAVPCLSLGPAVAPSATKGSRPRARPTSRKTAAVAAATTTAAAESHVLEYSRSRPRLAALLLLRPFRRRHSTRCCLGEGNTHLTCAMQSAGRRAGSGNAIPGKRHGLLALMLQNALQTSQTVRPGAAAAGSRVSIACIGNGPRRGERVAMTRIRPKIPRKGAWAETACT